MTTLVTKPLKMFHEKEPADVIRDDVGDISGYEPFHNLVLVGIYERPEKTRGGIILTEKTKSEDRYQGIVGLVLKVGPAAFKDDAANKFHGQSVSPGDWVVFRSSDAAQTLSLNGKLCRVLEDSQIKGRVSHPDLVF